MKRTLTSIAVATVLAAASSAASAVSLNPHGLGQVLIYPYYTVNSDNLTLITVVNFSDSVKALKLRMRESYNGRELLDYNLYLAEHDVWTGFIIATPEDHLGDGRLEAGGASLATRDQSCTHPALVDADADPQAGIGVLLDGTRYQLARPFTYIDDGELNLNNSDGGPQGIERTREGMLEIIELGSLSGTSAAAARHGSDGVPANCGYLIDSWSGLTNTRWDVDPEIEFEPPSGGLFGGASIINVQRGTLMTYSADAISGFSATILNSDAGNPQPNLASANSANMPVIDGQQAAVRAYMFSGDQRITSHFHSSQRIDAVSAVLAQSWLLNEYNLETDTESQTEWVVSFPTRQYYVDSSLAGSQVVPPFAKLFDEQGACVSLPGTIHDRESDTLIGVPGTLGPYSLCNQVQALTFSPAGYSGPSRILGADYRVEIETGALFDSGYMRLALGNTPHLGRPSLEGHRMVGLPVSGFSAQTVTNATLVDAQGTNVLSNYGGLFRHRGPQECQTMVDGGATQACE